MILASTWAEQDFEKREAEQERWLASRPSTGSSRKVNGAFTLSARINLKMELYPVDNCFTFFLVFNPKVLLSFIA